MAPLHDSLGCFFFVNGLHGDAMDNPGGWIEILVRGGHPV